MLDCEGGDGFELGLGEDLAAGVGGRVDDDGAGARGDGGLESVGVEREIGIGERDEDGVDAQRLERGDVVAVEGLEEQNLVAGIDQRHDGRVKSAGGAGGDKDFGLGVVGERVVALLLRRNGVAQAVNAVEAGVDVVAGVNGRDGFGLDRRGHGGVADALGQVDAADGVASDGHGADFRLEDTGSELAQGQARRGGGGGHEEDPCFPSYTEGGVGGVSGVGGVGQPRSSPSA